MQRSSKFIYSSLGMAAFFLTPTKARVLLIAILLAGAAVAFVFMQNDQYVIGWVVEYRQSLELGGNLATISRPGLDSMAILIPRSVSDVYGSQSFDLVVAIGNISYIQGSFGAAGQTFLIADTFGWLPSGAVIAAYDALALSDLKQYLEPWILIAIAAILVLANKLVFPVAAGVAIAIVFTVLSFALLQLNAHEAILPIPQIVFPGIILAFASVGLGAGIKATVNESNETGERIAALLLSIPLMTFLSGAGVLPESISWILPFAALLLPVVVTSGYAALLTAMALDLNVDAVRILLGSFTLLQIGMNYLDRPQAPAEIKLNENGEFLFEDLLDSHEEGKI